MTLDELRLRAQELPREDREVLGVELLSSFETPDKQADIDAAWASEILARSDAYRSGNASVLEAAGSVERIRRRLLW